MSDGLYNDIERLLTALYPDARARAPRAATMVFRLLNGEPISRLCAEVVRASSPTIPPPPAAESSPIPPTLPDAGRTPKGKL